MTFHSGKNKLSNLESGGDVTSRRRHAKPCPSPGERYVALERMAAAIDPLNLIRLTPA